MATLTQGRPVGNGGAVIVSTGGRMAGDASIGRPLPGRLDPIRLPSPPLSDGIIALRAWAATDVPAVVAACQDSEIPRWTLVPRPYTPEDARLWLATHAAGLRSGRRAEFAIVAAGDHADVLGSIALVRHPTIDDRAEVGYWIAAPARGRGVATRAVRLTAAWGFGGLGVRRIELLAEPGNVGSQRVAERAGFRRERMLKRHRRQKGTWRDFHLFALTAGEDPAIHSPFRPGSD